MRQLCPKSSRSAIKVIPNDAALRVWESGLSDRALPLTLALEQALRSQKHAKRHEISLLMFLGGPSLEICRSAEDCSCKGRDRVLTW